MSTAKKFTTGFLRSLPTALVLAAVLIFAARHLSGGREATPVASSLQESFSFEIKDLAVRHQGGNTLHLRVRYTYVDGLKTEEYPDFRGLATTCEDFFVNDRDESAFWEVVNKELTAQLLEKFPALASVQIDIQVAPSTRIPWPRASSVTRTRS